MSRRLLGSRPPPCRAWQRHRRPAEKKFVSLGGWTAANAPPAASLLPFRRRSASMTCPGQAGSVTTKTDPGTTGQKVGGGSATGHNAPTFNRRELREAFKWGDTRLRTHLDELVEMEYVVPLSGRLARPISIGWYMNQSRPKAGFWRASSQWNKYGRKRSLLARAARTSRVFWATSQVKMTTSHPQTGTSHPPRRWQPARWKTRF